MNYSSPFMVTTRDAEKEQSEDPTQSLTHNLSMQQVPLSRLALPCVPCQLWRTFKHGSWRSLQ